MTLLDLEKHKRLIHHVEHAKMLFNKEEKTVDLVEKILEGHEAVLPKEFFDNDQALEDLIKETFF